MKTAILFINGEVNIAFCQNYILKHYPGLPLYCADGAYDKVVGSLLDKYIEKVIGDGDSIDNANLHHHDYILIPDQYATDFEKALSFLHQSGYQNLIVFGAAGGELDHCFANISSALKLNNQLNLTFVDAYSYAFFLNPQTKLSHVKGKMISIMPLWTLDKITLTGCRYNLSNQNLSFGESVGIRNHAIAAEVCINYESGNGLVFVSHNNYHGYEK
ncbi:thiamine diphosphokinase [Facilibium subflavum]|uniref:thiamine diphosphokinase n=1 Tax=Facilibium subflavum TaxID=2219058 RepID=UPI0013C313A2|nr:thiamine diphosphokinase [Facilibium subflavum]